MWTHVAAPRQLGPGGYPAFAAFFAVLAAAFFRAFICVFRDVLAFVAMVSSVWRLRRGRGRRAPSHYFFLAFALSASALFQPSSQAFSKSSLASAISFGTRRGLPAMQAS